MSVFLCLLGVAMMVTGIAAIYSGSLFVGIERGWTMVVAGSIGFSAGAILLGLSAALRRLRRIEKATKRVAEAYATLAMPSPRPEPELPASLAAPVPAPSPPDAGKTVSAPTGKPAAEAAPKPDAGSSEPARERPADAAPESSPAPEKIVGTYKAGDNSYVMYADGSIRADTPSGEHRFGSMDEFKAFMLTSAVRSPPPETPKKEPNPEPDSQAPASPTALSAKA